MPLKLFALNDQDLDQVAGGRSLGPTFVYTLQNGDTLPKLAQRYGTTVRRLCDLNGIGKTVQLKAGDRILIPQR